AFNTSYDNLQVTNLLYNEIYAYSFDVTIETSNFALFSDIVIGFSSDGTGWSDSITLAPDVDSAGTMRFVSGPVAWPGVETDFFGAMDMELFSVFDQFGEEARLLDGSVCTFHTQIPAPGTMGVLVLGGIFGVRRRR